MIVRLWSARTTNAQSRAYLQHFSSEVLPALRKFAGYVSSLVLTRPTESAVEIMVMTVWQSFSALLTDYDRRVRHFEVARADNLSFG
jgi:hypothetical protein